jgi:hypothetical protein
MATRSLDETRPSRLPDGAPMDFAPENELGVVFLFSHVARKHGFEIARIRAAYPDCIAYRDGKRVRIEFEHRSSNFARHRHKAKDCDWIVCWVDGWPAAPSSLQILELRIDFGLGFNVWFQPAGPTYHQRLDTMKFDRSWSVASQAHTGDLVLFYRTAPQKFVRDVFRIAGRVKHDKAGWKPGKDWMAPIQRVCTLKTPLHLSQMRNHPRLRDASFIRGAMRGRFRATFHWPDIYRQIIDANPSLKQKLHSYEPGRIRKRA